MEYQFEVIHREGKLNCCADALSRICVDDIENSDSQKITCMVTTRNRTKQLIQNQNNLNQNEINASENSQTKMNSKSTGSQSYSIIERRGFILESKEYDHITFFFDKLNCKLKKQLQHKMKMVFDLKKLNYGELMSFDENKSIMFIPTLLNLKYSWRLARVQLIDRKEKNKQSVDNKNKTNDLILKESDLVLMINHEKKTKYDQTYIDPYEIVEITGPNTVKMKLRDKNKIFRAHKDQLKYYSRSDE